MNARPFALLLVIASILLSGCAAPQQPTGESLRAAAEAYAAFWGATPQSNRAEEANRQFAVALTDARLLDAWRKKPLFISDEAYWTRLEREGAPLLPDEDLRIAAQARGRLFEGISEQECISYKKVSSNGAWLSPDGDAWRKRLARASDEDFRTITSVSIRAAQARAASLDSEAFSLSRQQQISASATLSYLLNTSDRDLIRRSSESGADVAPKDFCHLMSVLLTAQSHSSGDVLRLFFVLQPN
jgi:hypothetical protein